LTEALLEVRALSRRFGDLRAVDALSFEMQPGMVYGFIGPNGAGKTTTMRILATLDLPDAGDALLEGVSLLAQPRAVRKRVGFMSDQFTPYPNLTRDSSSTSSREPTGCAAPSARAASTRWPPSAGSTASSNGRPRA
jgi:ABC-type multidrug transport system ATPase subunit